MEELLPEKRSDEKSGPKNIYSYLIIFHFRIK